MKKIVVRIIITAVAFALTARYVPGVEYEGGILGLVAITMGFGIVNLFVKPVVVFLSLPIQLFTLGLFRLVVNGGMLYLTALLLKNLVVEETWFAGIELGPLILEPFYIPFWGVAIIGAVSISTISGVLNWLVD